MRIDVAFKQTHQTLELTFDNFQRVDGTADYYDGTYDVTPLITAQTLPTRSKTMRTDQGAGQKRYAEDNRADYPARQRL